MTDVTLGRRERKKEETRQRIFLAAVELFNEKGFDSTTIDDISQRADVAKGTFFNYFPRKESILQGLAEDWLEVAEAALADRERPAAERIVELFVAAAAAYGRNRELSRRVMRVSMEQMCCPEPEGACARLVELFRELFREGQARGEIRTDIEPHPAFGAVSSVFIGTLLWWVGRSDGTLSPDAARLSLPEAVRHQLSVVFDGLKVREAT
jgi:AcrR family transcriptional regulator